MLVLLPELPSSCAMIAPAAPIKATSRVIFCLRESDIRSPSSSQVQRSIWGITPRSSDESRFSAFVMWMARAAYRSRGRPWPLEGRIRGVLARRDGVGPDLLESFEVCMSNLSVYGLT